MSEAVSASGTEATRSRAVLTACCGAHLIQDGLVALQFVLLPILAQSFGLSYAQVGALRAISNTAMALLEVPSGILAERVGERRLLALGLVAAAVGYLGVSMTSTFVLMALYFLLSGAGAAFQHSLASSVLVHHFDDGARRKALGSYNASGDAGKLAFTGIFSLSVGAGFAWNGVVALLAVLALAFALALTWLLRESRSSSHGQADAQAAAPRGWGILDRKRFTALGVIVFVDSMAQTAFLTFLAFVLLEKGAGDGVASMAVVLALAGGMVGKFGGGFLASRMGDRASFVLLQVLTVAGVAAMLLMPMMLTLLMLPLIGLVVQGSSTVTYGSVADFVQPGRQSRGYGLIYTFANAGSMAGPFVVGIVADLISLDAGIALLAVMAAATVPLAGILAPRHTSAASA